MRKLNIKKFVENSSFSHYLETCWNGTYYRDFPLTEDKACYDPGGTIPSILMFAVYAEKLGLSLVASGRAAHLAGWLADRVNEDGYIITQDGVGDHPASNSNVADALGTAAWYSNEIGLKSDVRQRVIAALLRIVDGNSRIRYPEGVQGKTQQLRFELRVYYWAWILTKDECRKKHCLELFNNGVKGYVEQRAIDGLLLQPSLYPDWTWNYAGVGGSAKEYATNTHAPAYYCTEPNGFMFVYNHGLQNDFIARNDKYDQFCRKYIMGLFRNISRAGHLASDVDGYGIHRAWYGPVLIEGIPLEAATMASILDMPQEASWLRWYIDRYIDFVKRSPDYLQTGLPDALPYGHQIGIESQFSKLASVRFYASLMRALAESGIETSESREPPSFGMFAWHAQWLRISTPIYETSFVGCTSLRNIPVVKNFGDSNLGTLIGGAPLTTLFVGNELMYAASFPIEGIWHIETKDHNGRLFQSCATSFDDESNLLVRHSKHDMLDTLSFQDYDTPELLYIEGEEYIETSWQRKERKAGLTYSVKGCYSVEELGLKWSVIAKAGYYVDNVSFCMPVPADNSEYSDGINWLPLTPVCLSVWPKAVRWRIGSRYVVISISSLSKIEKSCCQIIPIDPEDGLPGGLNSFCPYQLVQIRLELIPQVTDTCWQMQNTIRFENV